MVVVGLPTVVTPASSSSPAILVIAATALVLVILLLRHRRRRDSSAPAAYHSGTGHPVRHGASCRWQRWRRRGPLALVVGRRGRGYELVEVARHRDREGGRRERPVGRLELWVLRGRRLRVECRLLLVLLTTAVWGRGLLVRPRWRGTRPGA